MREFHAKPILKVIAGAGKTIESKIGKMGSNGSISSKASLIKPSNYLLNNTNEFNSYRTMKTLNRMLIRISSKRVLLRSFTRNLSFQRKKSVRCWKCATLV